MMQPGESSTKAVRAVFVIDPKGIIRTIIYYPLSMGRNFDELLRVLQALQTADAFGVATPADWRPGDDVIVPTAGSCGVAKERMGRQGSRCHVPRLVLLHQEDRQGEGAQHDQEEEIRKLGRPPSADCQLFQAYDINDLCSLT